MAAKMTARFVGVFLLVLGVCGFVPGLTADPRPSGTPADVGIAAPHEQYRRLFSALPTNGLLSVLFIVLGGAGVALSFSTLNARRYTQSLFVISLVLLLMALVPATSTGFGYLPIGGFTTALWFFLMMIALYPAFFVGPIVNKLNEPVFRQPD